MLSFFKINDPFRLVPILLIAYLLKLPAFLHPAIQQEITHWFVIGEAMQSGTLYVDIWDGMGPFSAIIFQAITWLFGRSVLSLYIIGTLLTFIQAAVFNNMLIRAKVFESNTYLPAIVYVLFTSVHPGFFTLSPVLLGLTLVLLGLGNLLRHVEFRAKKDIQIIMIGLYFGVAALFHFSYIVMLPVSVILLLIFTNTLGRRYLLLFFGGIFPMILTFFYYWLKSDHSGYFIHNFLFFNYWVTSNTSIGWVFGLMVLSVPILFTIIGLLSFGRQMRLTNYQTRIVQLFLLFGVLMLSFLLLEAPISFFSLVIFLPVFTFITVHLTSIVKRSFYSTILSVVLFGSVFFSLWVFTFQWIQVNPSEFSIASGKYEKIVKGKPIMVIGAGKTLYKEATLAGPFYNWDLSREFFNSLDYYDNLVFLQNHIEESKPDIIIDLENKWLEINERLPMVAQHYFEYQPHVWKRKD
ncbi:MAG: hypothetical protein KDC58_10510 [Cyclobacteriaceae bacterium]|nr:hypothetical protein [Cyclobacteriaceae bacterium]